MTDKDHGHRHRLQQVDAFLEGLEGDEPMDQPKPLPEREADLSLTLDVFSGEALAGRFTISYWSDEAKATCAPEWHVDGDAQREMIPLLQCVFNTMRPTDAGE